MDDTLLNAEQVADFLHLCRSDNPTAKQKREALAHYLRTHKFPDYGTSTGKRLWLKSEVIAHYKDMRREEVARRRKQGPADLHDGGAAALKMRRRLQLDDGLLDEDDELEDSRPARERVED